MYYITRGYTIYLVKHINEMIVPLRTARLRAPASNSRPQRLRGQIRPSLPGNATSCGRPAWQQAPHSASEATLYIGDVNLSLMLAELTPSNAKAHLTKIFTLGGR